MLLGGCDPDSSSEKGKSAESKKDGTPVEKDECERFFKDVLKLADEKKAISKSGGTQKPPESGGFFESIFGPECSKCFNPDKTEAEGKKSDSVKSKTGKDEVKTGDSTTAPKASIGDSHVRETEKAKLDDGRSGKMAKSADKASKLSEDKTAASAKPEELDKIVPPVKKDAKTGGKPSPVEKEKSAKLNECCKIPPEKPSREAAKIAQNLPKSTKPEHSKSAEIDSKSGALAESSLKLGKDNLIYKDSSLVVLRPATKDRPGVAIVKHLGREKPGDLKEIISKMESCAEKTDGKQTVLSTDGRSRFLARAIKPKGLFKIFTF